MKRTLSLPAILSNRTVLASSAIVAVQAVAAFYFLIDGIDDLLAQMQTGIDGEVVMECIVAFALLAGVVTGARHTQRLLAEARRREAALDMARGAMGELIRLRFAEWGLSRAEAEVSLFALKGSSIAEIAKMRNAAEGTVRSQLSQVYSKAGVKNQPMLLALFIDDLLEPILPEIQR